MAEAVLFNIAKSLLEQLSSPLKDELFLLWASKCDLKKLHNTISTIKDVLQDAEKKHATDSAVKTWLQRLQREMYKADDLFDEISTRALQKRVMSGNKIAREVHLFFSKSNHLALLVSTAHKVKELRGNLDDISNDIHQFDFLRCKIETPKPIVGRHEEHSYVNRDEIIGRDTEKESIVNSLKADAGDGARVAVIAVIGFGGLGKTGLAQLVYNELKEVPGQFDLYLWACVNSFSNLNLALEKIVACGTKEKFKDYQLEQLQEMLREKITGRKYLLVLDDVWEENIGNWGRLKCLLDVGNLGSKILVTARSEGVAKTLSAAKPYHQLKGLSDEDAWSLFKKFAFYADELEKIRRMEKIGKDIVRRCGNIPLALRSMGSLLRDKDESRWPNALKDEICGDVMEVLKVSYDDLPSLLKHCFAYCSLFPKDSTFSKEDLIRLWMAQGYLESSDKQKSLEDVGEENFNSLLQRCFFQDVRKGENGALYCKMHDLLHDLAIKVSGRDSRMVENLSGSFTEHLLHLSFMCKAASSMEFPPALHDMKGLRTLMFRNVGRVEETCFVNQVFGFKSLRVLELSLLRRGELPCSIGKLVHLRYLDISWNDALAKLPDSICRLQNLLTLDVRGCTRLKTMPRDLRLLCLRHLVNYGCDGLSGMPSGLKHMTCLVSLDVLVVNKASGGLRYLRDLNHLRGRITIKLPRDGWEDSVADAKDSMLRDKRELTELCIEWGNADDAVKMQNSDEVLDHLQPSENLQILGLTGFPGTKLSIWINSIENLKHLRIKQCHGCQHIPPLWQLQFLSSLRLEDLPLVEYMEDEICGNKESFFPCLVQLRISKMPKLKGWWRQATRHSVGVNPEQSQPYASLPLFPLLSDVHIRDCPEFSDMPSFPYVKRLNLLKVNEKLVRQSVLRTPDSVEWASSCIPVSISTSSSSTHQSWCGLEDLSIVDIQDLTSLPEEWAQHLSNVRSLNISYCHQLKTIPHCILQCLKHVEDLDISNFENLVLCNEEKQEVDDLSLNALKRLKHLTVNIHQLIGLQYLTTLKKLTINAFEKSSIQRATGIPWIPPPNLTHLTIVYPHRLVHLNGVFHRLDKLVSLEFRYCDLDRYDLDFSTIPFETLVGLRVLSFLYADGMRAIPERCQYLSNLQELKTTLCDDIECLPDWITRLQRLEVLRCPLLSKKYADPSDPFRSQIQLIPYVHIR